MKIKPFVYCFEENCRITDLMKRKPVAYYFEENLYTTDFSENVHPCSQDIRKLVH